MAPRVVTGSVAALGAVPRGWKNIAAVRPAPPRPLVGWEVLTSADPPALELSVTGADAALSWLVSPTGDVVDYSIFRRTPSTGAPFDPTVDTPVATGVTATSYADNGLAAGTYDWQVFGRIHPWDPLDIPDLVGYWNTAETASVTYAGGAASRWADLLGNSANDWVQSNASNKPAFGTRTQNGVYVMDFDGASDYMDGPNITLPAPWSVFAVVATDTLANHDPTILTSAASSAVTGHFDGGVWRVYCPFPNYANVNAADTNPHSLIGTAAVGATPNLYLDGALGGANGTESSSAWGALTIGASAGGGANYHDGPIMALGLVASVLSSTNRDNLAAYFRTQWATP